MLEVPDQSFTSCSCFGYGHWSLIHPWSNFLLFILILKVQRTSMSLKSWFGALDYARGSRLGFGILILIRIWSVVFDMPMIKVLALYLNFEDAKNIHALQVLILGFGGCWSFLTRVQHLGLDSDMVSGLWYTNDPNFDCISWFWSCKEYPCHWSPNLGIWRRLEVLDWGLAS